MGGWDSSVVRELWDGGIAQWVGHYGWWDSSVSRTL